MILLETKHWISIASTTNPTRRLMLTIGRAYAIERTVQLRGFHTRRGHNKRCIAFASRGGLYDLVYARYINRSA